MKEHTDPVCGMKVIEGKEAAKYEYKGTMYYFCGKGCMVAFKKDPEKFLKAGPNVHMMDH